jgi:hypothetical protein
MRIGVSSGGRWWVSMGPLGWLLTGWIIIPVMVVWYTLVLLYLLIAAIVAVIREARSDAADA